MSRIFETRYRESSLMTLGSSSYKPAERRHGWRWRAALIAGALAAGACVGTYGLPSPRTLVVRSGARVVADEGRMIEIDIWVREQIDNIEFDPSFWVISESTPEQTYPWDGLEVGRDTVSVLVYAAAPESENFLYIYGHFHLMNRMGRLDEFLPEAVGAEGYELLTDRSTSYCVPVRAGTWTPLSSPRVLRSSRTNVILGYGRTQDGRRSMPDGSSRPSRRSRLAAGGRTEPDLAATEAALTLST